MSIRKPIGLGLIVGILALAFAALPALASASTTLENLTTGKPLAVGTAIDAVSENLVFTGETGVNLECKKSTLAGPLTANAPTPIVNITSASFLNEAGGTACKTNVPGLTVVVTTDPNPPNWNVTFEAEDKFIVETNPTGGSIAFNAVFSNGAKCTFSRSTVTGTYNTGALLTLTVGAGQVFTASAESSPECGKMGTLDGSFKVAGVKAV
jgi:hypothetical protein